MEKRRTWHSFGLASLVGIALSLGLSIGGDFLLRLAWPALLEANNTWRFVFIGLEGLLVGAVLGRLVSYYPSLEGLCASLVIPVFSMIQTEFAFSLDSFVELLLKFEAHFAALYLAAFLLFMFRGGGMFYPRFIGLRYLRFKMITGITVIGVAFGVAGLAVVLSVMSGFENDLKDKIIGTNAHAIVQKKISEFVEYKDVLEKIKRLDGVRGATPFVYNEVMVSSEYNISGVFIKGIDPQTATEVTEFSIRQGSLELLSHAQRIDDYLKRQFENSLPQPLALDEAAMKPLVHPDREGVDQSARAAPRSEPQEEQPRKKIRTKAGWSQPGADEVPMPGALFGDKPIQPKSRGILIGAELQKILKVRVGDFVNVVSPLSEELGPSGPVPKARSFRVAGVFYTGMYEYDAKSVYVTLASAQRFFGLNDSVTGIALRFDELDRAEAICNKIEKILGGYPFYTRTWYQMNKNLFSALKMEKVGMFIVLIIVIIVSAFGIISTLIMLVWEKVKEIAILKSMGATGDGVMKIFMVEGITIGMVGTFLGVLLGWLICFVLQDYKILLDPEVYYIEALPINMDLVEFVLIAGIALHISFIATIYPSRRASRLRPAEGLRYD